MIYRTYLVPWTAFSIGPIEAVSNGVPTENGKIYKYEGEEEQIAASEFEAAVEAQKMVMLKLGTSVGIHLGDIRIKYEGETE